MLSRMLILLGLFQLAALPLGAQTWPSRSIKTVVGYAPGASIDINCRIALNAISPILGTPIVIENRPGSASIIGAQVSAHASPDGYNFFCSAASAIVTNPLTFKTLPYDPEKDFIPIGLIGTYTFVLLVGPQVPATSLAELIGLDKDNPGALNFASDGPRNFTGLIGTYLNKLAGTKFVQVPYPVITQGVQDTVAGRVQFIFQPASTIKELVEAKQLRAIAVTSLTPDLDFPSVAPVANTFPGYNFFGWTGIFAPSGTPPAVIEQFNNALATALRDANVVKQLKSVGVVASKPMSLKEAHNFVSEERERWKTLIKEIQLEPN